MRAPKAARREPVGIKNRSPNVLYVFEHKIWYILIHAPHPAPWYFDISVIYPNDFIE